MNKDIAYEDRHEELEQYHTSCEPGVEKHARNWSMAISLQNVDELWLSEFLHEQARDKINETLCGLRTRVIDSLYCTNFHRKSSATNHALLSRIYLYKQD